MTTQPRRRSAGFTLAEVLIVIISPMMLNIKTGQGGITRRENRDIALFVSSLHHMAGMGIPFLFTNQHAYTVDAEFFNRVEGLLRIDWHLRQSRNFKTDDQDPGKGARRECRRNAKIHLPFTFRLLSVSRCVFERFPALPMIL